MLIENQDLDQFLNTYFSKKIIYDAKRVIDNQQISFSFAKGDLGGFLTVSGLIGNHAPYETRVSFKDSTKTFTSSCKCINWTAENHCEHVVALLTKYLNKRDITTHTASASSIEDFKSGVTCPQFGTILDYSYRLKGANSNSSFFSLQYQLTTGKVVNLEATKPWTGKLIINLKKNNDLLTPDHENRTYHFKPTFIYQNEKGENIAEISLFDFLYLFNWQTGEVFDLPSPLKNLIKKIKIHHHMTVDELTRSSNEARLQNFCDLQIDNHILQELTPQELQIRIAITKSNKKNHLSLTFEFYTEQNEQLILPPDYFKIFCFEYGLLDTFRIKLEAYEFLKELFSSLHNPETNYRKYLRYSSEREKITEIVDHLTHSPEMFFFDEGNNQLIKTSGAIILNLFKAALEAFGEGFFKFSSNQVLERKIYYDVPKAVVFQGMNKFYSALQPLGIQIFYNKQEIRNWRSRIKFERVQSKVNWFDLNISVSQEDLNIIAQAEINEDFAITNDGLILLTEDQKDLVKLMKKYTEYSGAEVKIDPTDLNKQFKLSFNRARIFELFELKKLGIDGILTTEELDFCQRLLTLEEIPEYEVPAKVRDIVRPYQVVGFRWLRFLFENNLGACLADDMGLGKTIQAIIFLQTIIERVNRVLIVCPVSIILNWQHEIQKFSDLKVDVYYGDGREIKNDSKIILTSYGLMKKEAFDSLSQIEFDILILDEVQNLKNIRSVGANAARLLKAKFRVCLTGTPVENDLAEFYNIIDLSIPGIWGDLQFIKTTSSKKSRLLAKKVVRPFVLRRTKAQVLADLPEKVENHVFLELSDSEKTFYAANLLNIKNRLQAVGTNKKYGEILKGLLELRQLCLWQKQPALTSTKIDFLLENLELILGEGHKVLVFSQFTTYLDLIQDKIIERAWNYARIDGSQSMKTRQEQVEKFQNGNAKVFLISLKAGGVGLNLTAASYIFLMDPWWNPAVENQAIDRAHRIGQKNKLTVYRPIIKDSVEEKVLLLQQAKKELFNDLMSTDDNEFFSGRLTMDDFQALLT